MFWGAYSKRFSWYYNSLLSYEARNEDFSFRAEIVESAGGEPKYSPLYPLG